MTEGERPGYRDEEGRLRLANELARERARLAGRGASIMERVEDDLADAWRAYERLAATGGEGGSEKVHVARGRVRGLAQALATMKSPYSRADGGGDSARWLAYVRRVEQEHRP